jgi:hypothetical protein
MTTPVQTPARPLEPLRKSGSNIQNNKENIRFKDVLAYAAGRPALGHAGEAFVAARGEAALVGVPARPGSEPEPARGKASEEPPWERELSGDPRPDDRPLPDPLTAGLSQSASVGQLALSTLSALTPPQSAPPPAAGPVPFAELWTRLVRRVAWGGDGRRATARIEIGEGEWAGAAIVVHALEREIAIEIDLPAGARLEAWRERIASRLRERGLELSELTVR